MINFKVNYHNVDLKKIQNQLSENKSKFDEINQSYNNLSSLSISQRLEDLKEIKNVANLLIKKKEDIIVLGTGGSNLGARALINILQGKEEKKLHFFDNIDPIQFYNSIHKFDLKKQALLLFQNLVLPLKLYVNFLR